MSGTPTKKPSVPKGGSIKAQLVLVRQAPTAQSALPDSALVIGTVYRYSDNGSLWAQNYLADQPIYEIAIHHRQRRPTVTWNILDRFQSYLRRQAGREDSLPANLQELNESWHVCLVVKHLIPL